VKEIRAPPKVGGEKGKTSEKKGGDKYPIEWK
jgi:hypothetical protein